MDASDLFIGIDGGGGSSDGVIIDGQGRVVASTSGAGTNPNQSGLAQAAATIANMIDSMKASCDQSSSRFRAAGLCLSGIENESNRQALLAQLHAKHPGLADSFSIENDLAGVVGTVLSDDGGGGGAIVVVCGTGSSCAMFDTETHGKLGQSGGWGHMLGDEGSAYTIVRSACKSIIDSDDGFEQSAADTSRIRSVLFQHFRIDETTQLLNSFYGDDFSKANVAAAARKLAELAKEDSAAAQLFRRAGFDLGRHVAAVARRFPALSSKGGKHCPLILVGQVWRSFDLLREGLEAGIGSELARLHVYRLGGSTAVGAARMAARAVGVRVSLSEKASVQLLIDEGCLVGSP